MPARADWAQQSGFADPRGRSPAPPQLRSFLIETAIEGTTNFARRPHGPFMIQQVGGFFDEDSTDEDLVIHTDGVVHRLDRRYLSRIWPKLFTLPTGILVDSQHLAGSSTVQFGFHGKAIVVVAGVFQP